MSENHSGIRKVFSFAWAYRFAQWGIGATRFRKVITAHYIRAAEGARVFDLGSGTSDIATDLGSVEYFGLEPSAAYAEAARRRLGDGGTIINAGIDDFDPAPWTGTCDNVISIGVLHHLTDDQALALLFAARSLLRTGGRFTAVDPCLVDGQNPIARRLIQNDRGQHVRTQHDLQALVDRVFEGASITVRHDLLRLPYTHSIVEAHVD